MNRSKKALLAAYGLLCIVAVATIIDSRIAASAIGFTKWLRDWSRNSPTRLHAYLVSFLLSILGNTTIFIPVPYAALIFIMTSQVGLDPLLLGLISGLGAALGELTSYALGVGGGKYLERHGYAQKFSSLHRFMLERRRLIPLIIYVFAATPLPDDVLLVPLGIIRYGLVRSLIPTFLGKTTMLLFIAYFGSLVFGLGGGLEENPVTSILFDLTVITFIVTVVYLVVEYDWTRLLKNTGENAK